MLEKEDMTALEADVDALKTTVSDELQSQTASLAAMHTDLDIAVALVESAHAQQTAELKAQLATLQTELTRDIQKCQTPIVPKQNCSNQTVLMKEDRMVVGELERVRIEPPGFTASARIDTGAQSSSIHAENVTPFERDGEDWVRFDLIDKDTNVSIELPVERYVRVIQQSDKEGTRRPVVRMRIMLGNVKDSFDFTLADRSHLEQNMILGRNFLTDIAIVDVGRQYVQKPPQP